MVTNVRPATDDVKQLPTATDRQPYLHELVTAVQAPGVALSADDGQIRDGAHGLYWADRRLLSRLLVTVDGAEPAGVRAAPLDAAAVRFVGVLRNCGDAGADPTVTLVRDRTVHDDGLRETLTVDSRAREPVDARLRVEVGCDLAGMAEVKDGRFPASFTAEPEASGLRWRSPDGTTVRLRCDPAPDEVDGQVLGWPVRLRRGRSMAVTLHLEVSDAPPPVVLPSPAGLDRAGFAVESDDHRLSALVGRSLADLDGLVLADPLAPADRFLAAGAPWFLTLFGRDAIWAARMLLPLDVGLAAGTLRALARRQGTVSDAETAQDPGKIMHEIRAPEQGGALLPPLYYGTVDATALWISLLHDAWRWGLPDEQVAALLPAAERAMGWLLGPGTDAHGFVSYRDASGRGLANQGWKDSSDSVQFRDGRLARAPIALCEVQGYAVAAARHAAALATAFDRPGADRWLGWADGLEHRFRQRFWVPSPEGDYPAIAVDADGRPVDSVTSNIAHLLGTGLLDAGEQAAVVRRLAGTDMDSGYGLRTMSSDSAGFNPLSYHGGSVWTHDTAIAITGLAAVGRPEAAALAGRLTLGLLNAAPAFGFRLPELFGGHARAELPAPVPYPAACRPQAWAAAAALAAVGGLLGLQPDVPGRTIEVRPVRPSPVGRFAVQGLRVGPTRLRIEVDAAGTPTVHGVPDGFALR